MPALLQIQRALQWIQQGEVGVSFVTQQASRPPAVMSILSQSFLMLKHVGYSKTWVGPQNSKRRGVPYSAKMMC